MLISALSQQARQLLNYESIQVGNFTLNDVEFELHPSQVGRGGELQPVRSVSPFQWRRQGQ
jgi:hypothetical protein